MILIRNYTQGMSKRKSHDMYSRNCAYLFFWIVFHRFRIVFHRLIQSFPQVYNSFPQGKTYKPLQTLKILINLWKTIDELTGGTFDLYNHEVFQSNHTDHEVFLLCLCSFILPRTELDCKLFTNHHNQSYQKLKIL